MIKQILPVVLGFPLGYGAACVMAWVFGFVRGWHRSRQARRWIQRGVNMHLQAKRQYPQAWERMKRDKDVRWEVR